MANVSLEVVFGMFFLTLSNIDVDFLDWELWWRIYTIQKAVSTSKCVKLMEKKEITAAALNLKH